ncbi:MAG: FGGY-family carbohydrate kinase [Phycisphaeraceae bacterium]
MKLYLGIDIGTSGVRTSVIDATGKEVANASVKMAAPDRIDGRPCQDPAIWWNATCACLELQRTTLESQGHAMSAIAALSVDGTSGTLLLTDANLNPLTSGYLYNSAGFNDEAQAIEGVAPADSIARGPGSGLTRLLFLQKQADTSKVRHALHQADWIVAKLMRQGGKSDETNALKTGFDVLERRWPDWIADTGVRIDLLPDVHPVGDTFGEIDPAVAQAFGLSNKTNVIAGVTDSNAAFLASGASKIGEGMTSLGTTLAIKLLSDQPVFDPERGVYSHRIKDMWLPGGASNTGGGVLLEYFTSEQMQQMTPKLHPGRPTHLSFYPLKVKGERFPINDPDLQPRLTPRPDDDVTFFQAMLEGIAEVEQLAYAALRQAGAPAVRKVYTAGGGASNEAWTTIRQTTLGVTIGQAESRDASNGVARIAAGLV